MKSFFFSLAILSITLTACKPEIKKSDTYKFLVGTYTQKEGHVDGQGEGIYEVQIDMVKKSLSILNTIKDLVNPSFLAITEGGQNIYCVNELSPNEKNWPGRISALVRDSLGYRKSQEAGTFGNAPCHISIHPDQTMFVITNYLGGNLCYGAIDKKGKLYNEIKFINFTGKSTHIRQDTSHLHQSIFTKKGDLLIVADLGADSIRILDVDAKASNLTYKYGIGVDSADGPRHMVLSKNEDYLYVLNELSNTISCFEFNANDGNLKFIHKVSTLPSDFKGQNTGGDIHISNDGHFLFASNRGHNSIVTYKLDGEKMEFMHHVKTGDVPRNFVLTKDGGYLLCANQNSNDIYIYELETNGNLNFMQKFSIPTPVCLVEI